jgi:hypothetical protein
MLDLFVKLKLHISKNLIFREQNTFNSNVTLLNVFFSKYESTRNTKPVFKTHAKYLKIYSHQSVDDVNLEPKFESTSKNSQKF